MNKKKIIITLLQKKIDKQHNGGEYLLVPGVKTTYIEMRN